jgi:hypothetical protein
VWLHSKAKIWVITIDWTKNDIGDERKSWNNCNWYIYIEIKGLMIIMLALTCIKNSLSKEDNELRRMIKTHAISNDNKLKRISWC